jgi:drug/metabolite transporter (DMT)-like permease
VNRLVAYLIRFAVILIGYVVAALAASAFLNFMFLASLGYTLEHAHPTATASLLFSIPFVALFVAYFAFMPAAIVILISEILSRRDWLFYALAGAVVALVFLGFVHQNADVDFDVTDPRAIAAVIGCGMVGGIFYWLSAGRWAGSWREPTSPEPSGS